MCYLVANTGGAGGSDLLTVVDITDFNSVTNETNIGTGTGTTGVEAIAYNHSTRYIWGVDNGYLGRYDLVTGVFIAERDPIGSGDGVLGIQNMTYVVGLAFDPTNGILYGVNRRTEKADQDLLFQIYSFNGRIVTSAFEGNDYVPIGKIGNRKDVSDIAFDNSGQLYGIITNDGSGDMLARIDKETGEVTSVGPLDVDGMEGLTFHQNGYLLGTTGQDSGTDSNKLFNIDTNTGAASNPRTLDNGGDYDAITCPVFNTGASSNDSDIHLATPPDAQPSTFWAWLAALWNWLFGIG